jgi:hypothetical protein
MRLPACLQALAPPWLMWWQVPKQNGAHVFAAERIHADDTTAPVLAAGKTRTGRLWMPSR